MPPPDSSAADVWTVGRILDWTTGHLKQHGSDTPRLDAEILLAHARRCPRIQLYTHYADPLSDAERAAMRDLVKRRAQAEPVAYLVGHREFFGLDFVVNKDVLVPRPDTETLVLELITQLRAAPGPDAGRTLLDVGTGSGCIAVSAAVNLSEAHVTAVDVSPQALLVASENAARHRVSSRVRFLESDLYAALAPDERYDVIASNPPYVADAEMETLPRDIRLHEPALALRAGPQGLDVIARLIAGAPAHLRSGGLLLIEISPEQSDDVRELLAAPQAFEPARVLKDAAGKARVIATRRSA